MALTRKQRKYRQNLLISFGYTRAEVKGARTHQDYVDLYDQLIEREIDKNSSSFENAITRAALGLPVNNEGKVQSLDLRRVNNWARWANTTLDSGRALSFTNGGFNGS